MKRVLVVQGEEEGHIGLQTPDGTEITVHPRYDFRIGTSRVPIGRMSEVEDHVIALAAQLENVRKGVTLDVRIMAHADMPKAKPLKLLRKGGEIALPGKARILGTLFRISREVSVGLGPSGHVDVLVGTRLKAAELGRGFLSQRLEQGLQAISQFGADTA